MSEQDNLLRQCREQLYKYSDEVDYQLNDAPFVHEPDDLAVWQEDKRQVDELLLALDEYFSRNGSDEIARDYGDAAYDE